MFILILVVLFQSLRISLWDLHFIIFIYSTIILALFHLSRVLVSFLLLYFPLKFCIFGDCRRELSWFVFFDTFVLIILHFFTLLRAILIKDLLVTALICYFWGRWNDLCDYWVFLATISFACSDFKVELHLTSHPNGIFWRQEGEIQDWAAMILSVRSKRLIFWWK